MRRILSVLLENESGALSRVVGLFSQLGYNIETLNVAPTDDHSLSRLTVTTTGDDLKIETYCVGSSVNGKTFTSGKLRNTDSRSTGLSSINITELKPKFNSVAIF